MENLIEQNHFFLAHLLGKVAVHLKDDHYCVQLTIYLEFRLCLPYLAAVFTAVAFPKFNSPQS